jgi:hypothetical protein
MKLDAQVVDYAGKLAQVKRKLPYRSAIRKSDFCDHIISMWLQGYQFEKISKFLNEQGAEFYISAHTLSKTLRPIRDTFLTPVGSKIINDLGGSVEVSVEDELKQLILIQKQRIDSLLRKENGLNASGEGKYYSQVRHEIETMLSITKQMREIEKASLLSEAKDQKKSPEQEENEFKPAEESVSQEEKEFIEKFFDKDIMNRLMSDSSPDDSMVDILLES